VFIYDRSRARGTRIVVGDGNTTFTSGARHDYDVVYLGYGADGHVGTLNLTGSVYEVIVVNPRGFYCPVH